MQHHIYMVVHNWFVSKVCLNIHTIAMLQH